MTDRASRECPACSDKLGHPVLCPSCQNNRALIESLRRQRDDYRDQLKGIAHNITLMLKED